MTTYFTLNTVPPQAAAAPDPILVYVGLVFKGKALIAWQMTDGRPPLSIFDRNKLHATTVNFFLYQPRRCCIEFGRVWARIILVTTVPTRRRNSVHRWICVEK